MKASTSSFGNLATVEKSWLTVLSELAKARLTALVLLTTLVGYYLGSAGGLNGLGALHLLTATGLLASGAAALNQYWERDWDARMLRTQDRPLPSGRLRPATALGLGLFGAVAGLVYLAAAVNLLTSLLGAFTLLSYVAWYTPLKRRTPLNTVIGAIPGAMPPLMGWAAARGELTAGGWALFALQFFWQVPHFLAIAWLYREDYARAGFRMLPVVEPDGRRTGRVALAYSAGMTLAGLGLFAVGVAGTLYLAGAMVLGGGFVALAWRFRQALDARSARLLFLGSILYLPLLHGLMVLDKVR